MVTIEEFQSRANDSVEEEIETLQRKIKSKYGVSSTDLSTEFVEALSNLELDEFTTKTSDAKVGSDVKMSVSYRYRTSRVKVYIPITYVVGSENQISYEIYAHDQGQGSNTEYTIECEFEL